jgi:hypothetical protein
MRNLDREGFRYNPFPWVEVELEEGIGEVICVVVEEGGGVGRAGRGRGRGGVGV